MDIPVRFFKADLKPEAEVLIRWLIKLKNSIETRKTTNVSSDHRENLKSRNRLLLDSASRIPWKYVFELDAAWKSFINRNILRGIINKCSTKHVIRLKPVLSLTLIKRRSLQYTY